MAQLVRVFLDEKNSEIVPFFLFGMGNGTKRNINTQPLQNNKTGSVNERGGKRNVLYRV